MARSAKTTTVASPTTTTTLLYTTLALYMTSCALEMAFISNMVYWLHNRAGGAFPITYTDPINHTPTFSLHGKPLNLLADQGHTSNGAAGTGFVLVGLGGILALWLRNRRGHRALHHAWLVVTVLAAALTLVALGYTFALTNNHAGQKINVALAATLDNKPYPKYVAYGVDAWTPENWLAAVLELPLASGSDRSDIATHLALMKGWRWNLVPMLMLSMAVSVCAFLEALRFRRVGGRDRRGEYELATEGKRMST